MIRHLSALAATVLAFASTGASATDFSFSGTLLQDNGKAAFRFTLNATSSVTLASLGYAGGTSAVGRSVVRGGFDPVLSLYGANGDAIDFNDDGAGATPDAVTGVAADPILTATLGAGSYLVYLTQYSNFGPLVVPGAFAFDGEPNFRGGFVDFYGSQRTGAYAFDIRGVDSATAVVTAAVPEPAAWGLMLVGLGGIGAALRRRKLQVAFA